MEDNYKKLLRKYIESGLKPITKKNYLEGVPLDPDNQEEQKAFSESLVLLEMFLNREPEAISKIIEILSIEPE